MHSHDVLSGRIQNAKLLLRAKRALLRETQIQFIEAEEPLEQIGILLVEGEEALATYLKRELGNHGHVLGHVSRGDLAYELSATAIMIVCD